MGFERSTRDEFFGDRLANGSLFGSMVGVWHDMERFCRKMARIYLSRRGRRGRCGRGKLAQHNVPSFLPTLRVRVLFAGLFGGCHPSGGVKNWKGQPAREVLCVLRDAGSAKMSACPTAPARRRGGCEDIIARETRQGRKAAAHSKRVDRISG